MRRSLLIAPLVTMIVIGFAVDTHASDEPATVVVKMVDKSATEFVFEPANIEVKPGDVVQFVQTGVMPHNVAFREVPEGTNLGGAKEGPYVMQPNERYELVIDDRFAKGLHNFVCTPHEAMGMKGTLTVK